MQSRQCGRCEGKEEGHVGTCSGHQTAEIEVATNAADVCHSVSRFEAELHEQLRLPLRFSVTVMQLPHSTDCDCDNYAAERCKVT